VVAYSQHMAGEDAVAGDVPRFRLDDLARPRWSPESSTEYVEPVRPRPSPFTIEGYLQGFSDLSDTAVNGRGHYRVQARLLVALLLLAVLTPVAIQLLGLFD